MNTTIAPKTEQVLTPVQVDLLRRAVQVSRQLSICRSAQLRRQLAEEGYDNQDISVVLTFWADQEARSPSIGSFP